MKIQVKNGTKVIKGVMILENVELELESGKVYGLRGPNGGGKTMLMRLISGLIRATEGEVYIDGNKLGKDIDFPDSVGLMLENPAFLPGYTGLQNLRMLARLRERIDEAQIRQTITDVGLDPDDKRKYRKYSLGMKQRLGIASAIMEKPELILLDEPTNALDEKGVEQICKLIARERDRGALVIVACHDAAVLEALSDEIFTVAEGKVERKAVP
ncbi:MAG: ATP-binding cassette domain-containing protein [Oscillospiraceae bacterium]|nr:ATP-binding cassette domain-containing protein [Oscillospiraceae bacterium]